MKMIFLILTLLSSFAPVFASDSPKKSPRRKTGKAKATQAAARQPVQAESPSTLLAAFEAFVGEHQTPQPAQNIRSFNKQVMNPASGLVDPLYQITLFAETLALIQKSDGSEENVTAILKKIEHAYRHEIINAYSPEAGPHSSYTYPSLLHAAAWDGNPAITHMLLLAGAAENINKPDGRFKTPCHYLAYRVPQAKEYELDSTLATIKLLTGAKANPYLKDEADRTPQMLLQLALDMHQLNKGASRKDTAKIKEILQQLPASTHEPVIMPTRDPGGKLAKLKTVGSGAASAAKFVGRGALSLGGWIVHSSQQRYRQRGQRKGQKDDQHRGMEFAIMDGEGNTMGFAMLKPKARPTVHSDDSDDGSDDMEIVEVQPPTGTGNDAAANESEVD
jgi:hypothetical protein